MCVCIDGGWGERWLGGLLFFLRSSGSDGRRVIEGVLNFMGLECAGESCLACLACRLLQSLQLISNSQPGYPSFGSALFESSQSFCQTISWLASPENTISSISINFLCDYLVSCRDQKPSCRSLFFGTSHTKASCIPQTWLLLFLSPSSQPHHLTA